MFKFATIVLGLYIGMCGLLYVFQRKLQYFPDTRLLHPVDVGLAGFKTDFLHTPDGERLVTWYAPPREGGPVIVYFHGNGQSIASRWERFKLFHDSGYGVLGVSYRGYGGSTGTPTELGLITDGLTAVKELMKRGMTADRMIYYGESLGTGIAVQLAARDEMAPGAIILESPFTSAADVARTAYWYVPVGLLMKDQFRSKDHLADISAPAFVFHGDIDEVIPFRMGEAVFAALKQPKEFVTVTGGRHVAPLTPDLWQRMDRFLQSQFASGG